MKAVLRLMLFSILLNLASGLLVQIIPEKEGQNFDDNIGELKYRPNDLNLFVSNFNNSINPTSDLQDSGDLIDNILDKLNLGIITKVKDVVEKYMFGFIHILASFLNLQANTVLLFEALITIGYVLAAISLWTGKDFENG